MAVILAFKLRPLAGNYQTTNGAAYVAEQTSLDFALTLIANA